MPEQRGWTWTDSSATSMQAATIWTRWTNSRSPACRAGPGGRVGADRRWRPARPADHCLVEFALEGEITEHLGYDRHDAAGRDGRRRDGDVLRLSALGVDREEPCDQTSGD